jgi:hypothetical protein
MHRLPTNSTQAVEALLDEREHLHIAISLAADAPSPQADKLHEMSIRLAQVECEIAAARRKLGGLSI